MCFCIIVDQRVANHTAVLQDVRVRYLLHVRTVGSLEIGSETCGALSKNHAASPVSCVSFDASRASWRNDQASTSAAAARCVHAVVSISYHHIIRRSTWDRPGLVYRNTPVAYMRTRDARVRTCEHAGGNYIIKRLSPLVFEKAGKENVILCYGGTCDAPSINVACEFRRCVAKHPPAELYYSLRAFFIPTRLIYHHPVTLACRTR